MPDRAAAHMLGFVRLTVILIFCLAAGVSLWGCSTRQLMVDGFVDMVETGLPAFEQEDDLILLADAMPAHIKLFETVLANDPDNPQLLILLSRLYGAYAFAVLETKWEQQKYAMSVSVPADQTLQQLEARINRYFEKGIACAVKAISAHHPGAGRQLGHPRQAAALLESLEPADVPAIFWYGFNLGFLIQHNLDAVDVLARAHMVEKAMQRVLALEPGYYHGSAHIVLMVYYASRSPMMGGNPKAAARHYQLHKQQWPKMSGLREMYWARYYLVQQQDREAFMQVLDGLDSNTSIIDNPLAMLERVAAVRAEVYLKAADQLFDDF